MEPDSDIPLRQGAPLVAITANVKTGNHPALADQEAELDNPETVQAIADALHLSGCRTELLNADRSLPETLLRLQPDFVFNIAEGLRGRDREAQVPALLDMLNLPYTGSDATTLCIALDKALTKRILSTYHVKTPPYLLLHPDMKKIPRAIPYPVIVKPNAEGSSKGISDVCIAKTPEELTLLMERNFALYQEDLIAETFVGGREFTVGLLGNGEDTHVFPPMEIVYTQRPSDGLAVYNYTIKQDYTKYVRYECPAKLDAKTEKAMIGTAKKIFLRLGCRDFARIDFRLSDDGNDIHFIEINPLPGLQPGYSDYPMLADFSGVPYEKLICRILSAAIRRTGAPIRLKEAAL